MSLILDTWTERATVENQKMKSYSLQNDWHMDYDVRDGQILELNEHAVDAVTTCLHTHLHC